MQLAEKFSASRQVLSNSQLNKEIYELTISMLGECEQLPLPETIYLMNFILIRQLSKLVSH